MGEQRQKRRQSDRGVREEGREKTGGAEAERGEEEEDRKRRRGGGERGRSADLAEAEARHDLHHVARPRLGGDGHLSLGQDVGFALGVRALDTIDRGGGVREAHHLARVVLQQADPLPERDNVPPQPLEVGLVPARLDPELCHLFLGVQPGVCQPVLLGIG